MRAQRGEWTNGLLCFVEVKLKHNKIKKKKRDVPRMCAFVENVYNERERL